MGPESRCVLKAVLGRTRYGRPMAVVEGLPGATAVELTPGHLRVLADVLLRVALEAETRPMGRDFQPVEREYRLD